MPLGIPSPHVGIKSVLASEGPDEEAPNSSNDIKRALLRDLAWDCMSSFPGLDEKASNAALHPKLRHIIKDSKELTPFDVDWILS